VSERPMRPTKTTRLQTPNSGNAAARRVTLATGTTRVAIGSLAPEGGDFTYVAFYEFGDATVDCAGVADADGYIMPHGKESAIPVPSGTAYLSVYAGADFDILVEEGVTTP
jgi:hypothetical protein